MALQPDYKIKSDIIKEALVQARGSLADAAKYIVATYGIDCSRQYVKHACEQRTELLGFYDDLRQEFIDKAETNIFDAVMAGDLRTSITVAQTLGKERGWTQKQEVEVVDKEGSVQRIHEARERARAARKAGEAAGEPTDTNKIFYGDDQPHSGVEGGEESQE